MFVNSVVDCQSFQILFIAMDLNHNQPDDEQDAKEAIKAAADSKAIDSFEEVLQQVGGWGPFQWYITAVNLLFSFYLGTVTYSPIITLFTPDHFCRVEELHNLTMEDRRKLAIPPDTRSGQILFKVAS